MSQPIASKPRDELVFYVDEESDDFADDFTFHIRDHEDTVLRKLEGVLKASSIEANRKRKFSFSERILVKNLLLTKDNLKPSDDFWGQLQSPAPESPHAYLRKKLEGCREANDFVTKLSKKALDESDRKGVLRIIRKILKEAIKGESLENERWIKTELPNKEAALIKALLDPAKQKQWQNRIFLEYAFPDLIKATQAGRGLICFSYVGRYLSVTFRKISEKHGYEAGHYLPEQQEERKDHLFSLAEYCRLLYREVFQRTGSSQHAQGMVVVTGSTKSGKSEIARGLIHLYLTGKTNPKRRHHLVTFEDPIERFYADREVNASYPWVALDLDAKSENRDYTPRQKEKDARLLRDALADALRQTPALFFVGETRNREEWKVLLDFAATGHLIITTAHAGSLVEAMHKIFEALKVETPADRSEIANKLLAVIHLRGEDLELKTVPQGEEPVTPVTNVLFPGLWRRTPRGIAALTSDGLASLLPFRPKSSAQSDIRNNDAMSSTTAKQVDAEANKHTDAKTGEEHVVEEPDSSLGRRWFIEQLIDDEETNPQLNKFFGDELQSLRRQAYRKASEWDLQGV